ncbi:ribonuclease D [Deltaproteobacteria bacterium]|nr:ribonuclease D [Deltaproteobacteria bacterium]
MFGETPLVLVETPEELAECAAQLSRARVIGVDTESDSFHHYREKVCLIQVSDAHTDFVIDPLKVPDLSLLNPIFANPDIVKVFHGADYDVVCLKRDFGFTMRGIFDTMVSAQFLGFPKFGLADLIHKWWGWTIDKKWQRHDWAARPLLDEHLDYARGDSHWLPAMRDLFLMRLAKAGRLEHVIEECEALQEREWQRPRHDPADFYRVKGARQLDERGLHVLSAVYRYRDARAEEQDRPSFKVLPDDILLELAARRPATMDEMVGLFRRGAPFIRRYGEGLLAAIAAGVSSEAPLPTMAEPVKREPGLRGQRAERLMGALKDWRNREVEQRGVPPIAVVSNNVLKELVRVAPRSREALALVPDLRRWQVQTYGDLWLAVIDDVLGPERQGDSTDPVDESPPARRRRRRRGDRKDMAEPSVSAEATEDAPTA